MPITGPIPEWKAYFALKVRDELSRALDTLLQGIEGDALASTANKPRTARLAAEAERMLKLCLNGNIQRNGNLRDPISNGNPSELTAPQALAWAMIQTPGLRTDAVLMDKALCQLENLFEVGGL